VWVDGWTGGYSDQDVHRIEVYFDLARIATSYQFNVFSPVFLVHDRPMKCARCPLV
jgi:hypothetical protein